MTAVNNFITDLLDEVLDFDFFDLVIVAGKAPRYFLKGQLVDSGCTDIISSEEIYADTEALGLTFSTGGGDRFDYNHISGDGEVIPFKVSTLIEPSGKPSICFTRVPSKGLPRTLEELNA